MSEEVKIQPECLNCGSQDVTGIPEKLYMVPAARVAQLEAEIAELKNKNRKMRVLQWITEGVYDDDAHIAAIAEAVKAGDWTKFLHDTYTAGIAHGRNVCNSEHEARTQKLLEALESHAIPAMQRQMHSDDACNMPFNEDMAEALQIADQALAEYRGGEK